MKFKTALASATAIALIMGGAAWAGNNNQATVGQTGNDNSASVTQDAGDNNISTAQQIGDRNTLEVVQDGHSNRAGSASTTNTVLRQTGNDNQMSVTQTGSSNNVAGFFQSPGGPGGAWQTGSQNSLTIVQESRLTIQSQNGNRIDRIRQSSANGAAAPTNVATITQQRDPSGDPNHVAAHRIIIVDQNHTGGAQNTMNLTQTGSYSSWYGGGQRNTIERAEQNGSGNTMTIEQSGVGPLLSGSPVSGTQLRGPSNHVGTVNQTGDTNSATVIQAGFQNYVSAVRQSGNLNLASINLGGNFNGATATAYNQFPSIGVLGGAAAAAGAAAATDTNAGVAAGLASSVEQVGSGNAVGYTVLGANNNQFGFWQYGDGNQAINILITGDANHLGVYQSGNDNQLSLASIAGMDNQMGLVQVGTSNLANLTINGDGNMGFNGFTAGAAGTLATSLDMTAGLMTQSGNDNQLTVSITGNNNVFASLQSGNNNTASHTVGGPGAGNQAVIAQVGNFNSSTTTQMGSFNNLAVSQ